MCPSSTNEGAKFKFVVFSLKNLHTGCNCEYALEIRHCILSKKTWTILYSTSPYKMGQRLLGHTVDLTRILKYHSLTFNIHADWNITIFDILLVILVKRNSKSRVTDPAGVYLDPTNKKIPDPDTAVQKFGSRFDPRKTTRIRIRPSFDLIKVNIINKKQLFLKLQKKSEKMWPLSLSGWTTKRELLVIQSGTVILRPGLKTML